MNWIKRESHNENSDGEKKYPFVRWMSWLFLSASLLLLIYTYYRAEIILQGGSGAFYFKYYLISLTGILFWVVVLRLREGIRANIVTVVTSLVVGLYMVEGGLIFLGLGEPHYRAAASSAAAEMGVEYDQRTKLEVIEDLITQGVDAVSAVRPRDVLTLDEELLPLGGLSHKTTVGENESGRRMIYLSDRYGFNNPDSEWDAKEVEWLLTGDSFAEGVAVQSGEDIAGQIRAITHQSSINLGRSGNGPLMELAELTEYAGAVKPRKVLWIYYEGNDLQSDFQRDKRHPLLMRYIEEEFSQNLISRQKEIDNRLEKYILKVQAQQSQLYKTRGIRLFAIRTILDFNDDFDFDFDADDPLFARILTKAKARVESWGGELYFVYMPESGRYNNIAISHDKFSKKAEVIDVVKQLDIPVIDIHQEVFANHPDPLSLFSFRLSAAHFNADGYRESTKAIVTGVNKYEQSNK
jgi:hypothetical protein